MASIITNIYKFESSKANVNLDESLAFNIALINDVFAVSSSDEIADFQTFSGDLQDTWEAAGTGYTSGGQNVSGNSVYKDDVLNRAVFSADDVIWAGATVSADGAVVYRVADSLPITIIDFAATKASVGGNFEIRWNGGIFQLI